MSCLVPNPDSLLAVFKRAVGSDRALRKDVAVDYAAGLPADKREAFWVQLRDAHPQSLTDILQDVSEARGTAAGVPEVMWLRTQNAILSQKTAAANQDMYRNLTCGGRPPHDYGGCPSCR